MLFEVYGLLSLTSVKTVLSWQLSAHGVCCIHIAILISYLFFFLVFIKFCILREVVLEANLNLLGCITTYLHRNMSLWILLKTCHLICWWKTEKSPQENNPLTHTLQRLWIFSRRDLKALCACLPHRRLLSLSSLASIISSFGAHAELKDRDFFFFFV